MSSDRRRMIPPPAGDDDAHTVPRRRPRRAGEHAAAINPALSPDPVDPTARQRTPRVPGVRRDVPPPPPVPTTPPRPSGAATNSPPVTEAPTSPGDGFPHSQMAHEPQAPPELERLFASTSEVQLPVRTPSGRTVGPDPTGMVPDRPMRYQLQEELGRGGMGSVHRAADPDLHRHLAIKLLRHSKDIASIARFVEEARITGHLQHPNIVPVHELGRDDRGRPFMAMKCVDGVTLHEQIHLWHDAGEPLSSDVIQQIVRIFDQICNAMAYAHTHNVIHRDLKPANVMVGRFGEVLVMDWGLARSLDREDILGELPASAYGQDLSDSTVPTGAARDHTVQGDVLGTVSFMAPEQAAGRINEVDTRSDIFSLGGVLYHMLTGARPYEDSSWISLRRAIERDLESPRRRAPHARIPNELDAIVMRAMAPDRRERYQTVQELQDDLAAFLANRSVSAHRDGWFRQLVKWSRRHPAAAATTSVASVALLAIGLTVSLWWGAERQRALADQQRRFTEQQLEAESSARALAEFESLARQGRVDELLTALGGRMAAGRNAVVSDFFARVMQAGGLDCLDAFVAGLDPAEVTTYIMAFRELMEVSKQFPEVSITEDDWMVVALLLDVGRDNPQEALQAYSAGINRFPESHRLLNNRSNLLKRMGRLAEAETDLRTALRIKPDHANAWCNLGLLHYAQHDTQAAKDALDRAIELDPSLTNAYEARAAQHFSLQDWQSAIADANVVLGRNPRHHEIRALRGAAQMELGNHREAVVDLEEALPHCRKVSPDTLGHFHNALGISHQAVGRHDLVEQDLTRAIELDPREPAFRRNRGRMHLHAGNIHQALADYEVFLELEPDNIQVRMDVVAMLAREKRFEESVRHADIILQAQPDHPDALAHRGAGHATLGRFDEAVVDLKRVLNLKPDDLDLRITLVRILSAAQRIEEMVDQAEIILRTDPANYEARTYRAAGYGNIGRTDEAIAEFTKLIEERPDEANFWMNRGQAYIVKNRLADARRDLEKAASLSPSPREKQIIEQLLQRLRND